MKLQQLRYISEVARRGLNVSATAEALYTSQPGISKQIRQLEEELGLEIFERTGRQLTRVTEAGETIIAMANRALIEVDGIRRTARELADPGSGSLSIATTHTQARYVLPRVVGAFIRRHPRVVLQIHQGDATRIAEMTAEGMTDFAITTEPLSGFDSLVQLPWYQWNRAIIAPCDNPLRDESPLTLEAIAEYPLLTYVFGFTGRSQLDIAFRSSGLQPRVVFTATDADVVKTYVRLGLGVGILAKMAYDQRTDTDLCALDASHLFEPSTTKIAFRRGLVLQPYMYDFIGLCAPHLTGEVVDTAARASPKSAAENVFLDIELPAY